MRKIYIIFLLLVLCSITVSATKVIDTQYTDYTMTQLYDNGQVSVSTYAMQRFAVEDGQWKAMEKLKSWKGTTYSCQVKYDGQNDVSCLDFNATARTITWKQTKKATGKEDVPVRVWSAVPVLDSVTKEPAIDSKTKQPVVSKTLSVDTIEQFTPSTNTKLLTIKAKPQEVIELGSNSTTVYIATTAKSDNAYCDKTGLAYSEGSGVQLFGRGITSGGHFYYSGLHFPDVLVPKYAVISDAKIGVTAQGSAGGGTTLNANITLQKNATSSTFLDTDTNCAEFLDRASASNTTTAYSWADVATWGGGSFYSTPSFSQQVEEVTNLTGWSSGNGITAFFITNSDTDVGAKRYYYGWDGGYAPFIENLTITFSTTTSTGTTSTTTTTTSTSTTTTTLAGIVCNDDDTSECGIFIGYPDSFCWNLLQQGTVTSNGTSYTDYCVNAAILDEYGCANAHQSTVLEGTFNCNTETYGAYPYCVNGACVVSLTTTTTSTTTTDTASDCTTTTTLPHWMESADYYATCTSTDANNSIAVRGYSYYDYDSFLDYCYNRTNLKEFYCDPGTGVINYLNIKCTNESYGAAWQKYFGCEAGRCYAVNDTIGTCFNSTEINDVLIPDFYCAGYYGLSQFNILDIITRHYTAGCAFPDSGEAGCASPVGSADSLYCAYVGGHADVSKCVSGSWVSIGSCPSYSNCSAYINPTTFSEACTTAVWPITTTTTLPGTLTVNSITQGLGDLGSTFGIPILIIWLILMLIVGGGVLYYTHGEGHGMIALIGAEILMTILGTVLGIIGTGILIVLAIMVILMGVLWGRRVVTGGG